jgi:hypothetical protein
MRVRCENCGHLRGTPSAQTGCATLARAGLPVYLCLLLGPPAANRLRHVPLERSWPALLFGALLLLAVALWCWMPAGVQCRWVLGRRACEACGQRRWSDGFHEGFGM